MAQTILIVDDDRATREGLALLLTEAGYHPLTASTVPSALQVLAERQPDVLIADVRLGAYNGLHLVAMAPRPISTVLTERAGGDVRPQREDTEPRMALHPLVRAAPGHQAVLSPTARAECHETRALSKALGTE